MARRAAAGRRLPAGDEARRRRVPELLGDELPTAATRSPPTASRRGTAWRSSRGSGSRTSSPASRARPGFPHPEARAVAATCGGVRVVVGLRAERPRRPDSDHYAYKLKWLEALRAMVGASPASTVVLRGHEHRADRRGRLRPRRLRGPDARDAAGARGARARCRRVGLRDVVRDRWPDERVFTYWDYRAGMFHQDCGMRIDLVLASERRRRARQGRLGRPPGAQGQGPERPRAGDRRPRRGARRRHRPGRAAAVAPARRGDEEAAAGRATSRCGRSRSRDGWTRLGSPGIFG